LPAALIWLSVPMPPCRGFVRCAHSSGSFVSFVTLQRGMGNEDSFRAAACAGRPATTVASRANLAESHGPAAADRAHSFRIKTRKRP